MVSVADSPSLHSHILAQLPVLLHHYNEINAAPLLGPWVLPGLLVDIFLLKPGVADCSLVSVRRKKGQKLHSCIIGHS